MAVASCGCSRLWGREQKRRREKATCGRVDRIMNQVDQSIAAEEEQSASRDFEAEATAVLERLRTSLAGLVADLPGHVSKPAELQRALQIDINLSCKAFKVIGAADPLAAGPHVPGGGAMRTFLSAARKAGVRKEAIGSLATAMADFDRLVASHAGERAAFDSMICSLGRTGGVTQITMHHRRAVFRGLRHILGVQARVHLKTLLIQPAKDPCLLDLVRIGGLLGLRRLRLDAPLLVSRVAITDDHGRVREVERQSLDSEPDQALGTGLLREFCTQPPPQCRTGQTEPGVAYTEILSNGVGKKAAVTYIEGYAARAAVPRYRQEANLVCSNSARIRIPCEALVLDLLVRADTFGPLTPRAFTIAEHWGEVRAPSMSEPWHHLEPAESVTYLGRGPSVLQTPYVPRYAEMGHYIFDRLGWNGNDFDVYRCRLEYPVTPSVVVIEFPLPQAPGT